MLAKTAQGKGFGPQIPDPPRRRVLEHRTSRSQDAAAPLFRFRNRSPAEPFETFAARGVLVLALSDLFAWAPPRSPGPLLSLERSRHRRVCVDATPGRSAAGVGPATLPSRTARVAPGSHFLLAHYRSTPLPFEYQRPRGIRSSADRASRACPTGRFPWVAFSR